MKRDRMRALALISMFAAFLASSCGSGSDDSGGSATPALNGVSISSSTSKVAPAGTLSLEAKADTTGSPEGIAYRWEVTDGATLSPTEGETTTLTAGSDEKDVTVTLTAVYGTTEKSATKTVKITNSTAEEEADEIVTAGGAITDSDAASISGSIKLSDSPVGFAASGTYNTTGTQTTVSTRSELLSALKKGGIIVVDGMIDMTDVEGNGTMIPSSGGGSTDALDAFVKANSDYEDYVSYMVAYAKDCTASTNDKSSSSPSSTVGKTTWKLNSSYAETVKVTISKNDTILIGKSAGSGIKGGSIQISGKSNIQIRNLNIKDAYDPFPHHEENDGYNAELDGICIQGESYGIWIDRCTFEDTLSLAHVLTAGTTDEKWQDYDGLCDIKGNSTNITVSNCKFKNHDKTMLIGSSDSDGDNTKRFVTLCNNYFYNCGQRLPMVRNTKIHIFNNYYEASNPAYSQQYAIGRRKNCIIYAENNYFGSGINYSIKETNGELHSAGNTDNSKKGATNSTDSNVYSDIDGAYTYSVVDASSLNTSIPSTAGAGYTLD